MWCVDLWVVWVRARFKGLLCPTSDWGLLCCLLWTLSHVMGWGWERKVISLEGKENSSYPFLYNQVLSASWRLTLNSLPFILFKKDLKEIILMEHNSTQNLHIYHSKWVLLVFKHQFQIIDTHLDVVWPYCKIWNHFYPVRKQNFIDDSNVLF